MASVFPIWTWPRPFLVVCITRAWYTHPLCRFHCSLSLVPHVPHTSSTLLFGCFYCCTNRTYSHQMRGEMIYVNAYQGQRGFAHCVCYGCVHVYVCVTVRTRENGLVLSTNVFCLVFLSFFWHRKHKPIWELYSIDAYIFHKFAVHYNFQQRI